MANIQCDLHIQMLIIQLKLRCFNLKRIGRKPLAFSIFSSNSWVIFSKAETKRHASINAYILKCYSGIHQPFEILLKIWLATFTITDYGEGMIFCVPFPSTRTVVSSESGT